MTRPLIDQMPRIVANLLRERGVSPVEFAREAGLEARVVTDGAGGQPRAAVPVRTRLRLLHRVLELSEREDFGLHLGAEVRPEEDGIVGYLSLPSSKLGEALSMLVRYKRYATPDRLELIEDRGEELTISVVSKDPSDPCRRQLIDVEMAFLVSFARRLTQRKVTPLSVQVSAAAPSHSDAYRGLFGCPIDFGAGIDRLVFDRRDVDLPIVSRNTDLRARLVAYVQSMFPPSSSETGIEGRVISLLVDLLPRGEPSIEEVARALGMSSRSLQRRLGEHKLSFREVVHRTRSALAKKYLRGQEFEPIDIAFLLGFAHVQSFYRAFRRWTGTTPEAFRRKNRTPTPQASASTL